MSEITDAEWQEILEDMRPQDQWLRYWHKAKDCCIEFIFTAHGCTLACRHGASNGECALHLCGEEPPVREFVRNRIPIVEDNTCKCGRHWIIGECPSLAAAHARRDAISVNISLAVSGDFDEATERARLMPV